MMELPINAHIEALLFFKGEPLSIDTMAKMLSISTQEVEKGISELKEILQGRGLSLIEHNGEYILSTQRSLGPLFETMRKEELEKELSKASLETLSIIIYTDGVTRNDIDYIRGVNSTFILRNLLIRGLIEKSTDPKDSRKNIYKPTFETLQFLGITSVQELPEYEKFHSELAKNSGVKE